jgi:CyaY protein
MHAGSVAAVTTTPRPGTELSDAEYHDQARRVFAAVESTVDRWLQDDVIDIDTQRTGGLLELTLPGGSKLIINTQPPLHELWLAARAGGYHFRFEHGRWADREGQEFFERLSHCASQQAGKPLRFASTT